MRAVLKRSSCISRSTQLKYSINRIIVCCSPKTHNKHTHVYFSRGERCHGVSYWAVLCTWKAITQNKMVEDRDNVLSGTAKIFTLRLTPREKMFQWCWQPTKYLCNWTLQVRPLAAAPSQLNIGVELHRAHFCSVSVCREPDKVNSTTRMYVQ